MNNEQIKSFFRQTFNLASEGYDKPALRFFRESAEKTIEILNPTGNERILDVATGTGHLALTLASRFPHAKITGIDLSDGMLKQARVKQEKQGLRNINFIEMDMTILDFPDHHFDLVVCGFGIFFIEDMETQLRHMCDKVKRGGKVAILTFEDSAFMPLWEVFFNHITSFGIDIPTMASKRVCQPEQCIHLFKDAGLKHVQCTQVDITYPLQNGNAWWDIVWNGGFRGMVNLLPRDRQDEFQTFHLREIDKLNTGSGIPLSMPILVTWGRKPE